MPRKTKVETDPTNNEAENQQPTSDPVEPTTRREDAADGDKATRIALTLTKDGQLAFDSMRDKTIVALRNAIQSDPTALAKLGIVTGPVKVLPDEMIATMWGVIGKTNALAARAVLKAPEDIANDSFVFTKEQIDALTPPTQRVLYKHQAKLAKLLAHKEEIELGMAFLSAVQQQTVNCKEAMAQRARVEAQKKAAAKAGVADKVQDAAE